MGEYVLLHVTRKAIEVENTTRSFLTVGTQNTDGTKKAEKQTNGDTGVRMVTS